MSALNIPEVDSLPELIVQYEEEHCSDMFLDDVLHHRFTFNNECFQLSYALNWCQNPSSDVEWQILLHKFYYAPGLIRRWLALGRAEDLNCFQHLITSWVEQTPSNFIASDVTARRLQNWAYAWYQIEKSGRIDDLDAHFVELFHTSVQAQVEALLGNLAPARNHRTLELYALFVVSLTFPYLPNAARWRSVAVRELVDNILEDLQSDGVHCEQSTDYHHIVLRSYLLFFRLTRLNGISVPPDIEEPLRKALDFALHVHRPDGQIPALSDSDSRSYASLLHWGANLFSHPPYAYVATAGREGQAPGQANVLFPESGYVVMRSPWNSSEPFSDARYLVFDAGHVGKGNHGHMDALSIELAAYGRSLVVDPGRYTYQEDKDFDWRKAFRETRAHSTVTVDDVDQGIYRRKRPNAKFKIQAPHPVVSVIKHDLTSEPAFVAAQVQSPNYYPLHQRYIWFVRKRYWLVIDRLINHQEMTHDYRLRYQLSHQTLGRVKLEKTDDGIVASSPGLDLWVAGSHDLQGSLESAWVSETYGDKKAAPRVCICQNAVSATFVSVLCPNPDALGTADKACSVESITHSDGKILFKVRVDDDTDEWLWQAGQDSLSNLKKSSCTKRGRTQESTNTWSLAEGNHHA